MMDEASRRRKNFQPGTEIRLADGQAWTFRDAAGASGPVSDRVRGEYMGLLRVHGEAEDLSERQLAELALALFLIELNYDLNAEELQALLCFPAGSPALAAAQDAFHALATEHRRAFQAPAADVQPEPLPGSPLPGLWARGTSWLRNLWSARRWSLNTSKGQAPL